MFKLKSLVMLVALSSFQLAQAATPVETKAKDRPLEKASFAEGCFWKTQYVFSKVPGVVRSTVGYSGGTIASPSYEQVCTHTTGHAESCLVEYDPAKVTYKKLLQIFFSSHDPTTLNRQGPDMGSQYRSVIFYENDKQKAEALACKDELEKAHRFRSPIVTIIEPAGKFYKAEEYHQNYFVKHGESCQ